MDRKTRIEIAKSLLVVADTIESKSRVSATTFGVKHLEKARENINFVLGQLQLTEGDDFGVGVAGAGWSHVLVFGQNMGALPKEAEDAVKKAFGGQVKKMKGGLLRIPMKVVLAKRVGTTFTEME